MATSQWTQAVATVKEYVVLIETPTARGTGFVAPAPPGSTDTCIVTALHVIQHAYDWREPIRIIHLSTNKQVFLDTSSRYINIAHSRDQAFILFPPNTLPVPQQNLPLQQPATRYNEGVQTGWLGYPAVAPRNLCFFCGHISAWIQQEEAYLVDGVAINGVSGGPAFVQGENDEPIIIGLVTEYRPNYATGNALPGVSLIRSVNPLLRHYTEVNEQLNVPQVQDVPESDLQITLGEGSETQQS